MTRRLLRLSLVLLLAACGSGKPQAPLVPLGDELPAVFGRLSFELVPGEARRLFPGKEIRDDIPGYDGAEKLEVTMVWGLDWPGIGPAFAAIAYDRHGRVRWLTVESDERREECLQPDHPRRPKGCRSEYGPVLVRILNDMRGQMERQYGLSRNMGGTAGGAHRGSREKSYSWRRPGFTVILAINNDEEGTWAVSVHAARKLAPIKPRR